jgi:uncharacterized membrane protein
MKFALFVHKKVNKMDNDSLSPSKPRRMGVPQWAALGAAIGAAIGVTLNDIAIGVGIGVFTGVAAAFLAQRFAR